MSINTATSARAIISQWFSRGLWCDVRASDPTVVSQTSLISARDRFDRVTISQEAERFVEPISKTSSTHE